jgi:hypothetical protein
MRRVLDHLRGNVVAYLALSVALGGTSYAAASLPRGSVGTAQLRPNAVTSAKVRDRSLATRDFSAATLGALGGRTGPVGPAGTPGTVGATGLTGATGATGAKGEDGAKGDKGGDGADGDKGDKGDPGPTFTGWGRASVQNGQALAAPDATVTDLAGQTGSGSGAITLPAQSRIYVAGSVVVFNNSTTEPSRPSCTPRLTGPGEDNLVFDAGPGVSEDLHQADADSSAANGIVAATLPVTGSVLVTAGTYDVGIVCTKAGNGTAVVASAAVDVIAVPEP